MAHRTLIDWSRWQDDDRTAAFPDLGAASARGVDGHLFKAGRGHDPDPDYARFVAEARRHGLKWGAYWWPEPCCSPPAEQARFTWATVTAPGRPHLPLDVDVEGHRGEQPGAVAPYRRLSPGEQAEWLRAYVDELKRLSGRDRLIIYTADWYWDPNIAPSGVSFADCDLRVAHYLPGTPPAAATAWEGWIGARRPDLPKGWAAWSGWQFSAQGNEAGRTYGAESVDLDLNVVRADVWARWAGGASLPMLPVVRAGARGTPVALVQALVNVHLVATGRPAIAETGDWPAGSSSPTSVAVAWFQGANGLGADRVVGPKTWAALLGLR
jgi:GH25 family lysozyme M1 (1,4-beta-N-acetylmuramidase)